MGGMLNVDGDLFLVAVMVSYRRGSTLCKGRIPQSENMRASEPYKTATQCRSPFLPELPVILYREETKDGSQHEAIREYVIRSFPRIAGVGKEARARGLGPPGGMV